MDFASLFIATVLISFFAGNYFNKYKEEKVFNDYIGLFVYVGFILEVLIIVSIAIHNRLFMYIFTCLTAILVVIQLYFGVKKINYFNAHKGEKNNFEYSILGVRNIFYVLGALIIVPQHLIYYLYNKFFK